MNYINVIALCITALATGVMAWKTWEVAKFNKKLEQIQEMANIDMQINKKSTGMSSFMSWRDVAYDDLPQGVNRVLSPYDLERIVPAGFGNYISNIEPLSKKVVEAVESQEDPTDRINDFKNECDEVLTKMRNDIELLENSKQKLWQKINN